VNEEKLQEEEKRVKSKKKKKLRQEKEGIPLLPAPPQNGILQSQLTERKKGP